jgi:mannitol/fructose-specific phosphotransferase system IIA component (Ntr-type)
LRRRARARIIRALPPSLEPRIADVLSAGILLPRLRCADLDEALLTLLAPPLSGVGLDAAKVTGVLHAVKQREATCSTVIGPVSLPHARVPGLERIVAGLGANPDGVYGAEAETSFVLAFASPAQSAVEHLRFLARAAQLFRDEDARAHLLAATDRDGMLEAIRKAER